MLLCPVCKKELTLKDSSYVCPSSHCFDISKSGYVNLLTTKGHNPKTAGDNADMIKARSAFLEKDYYKPLSDKVAEIISENINTRKIKSPVIIDSGCGEGYYTANFALKNKNAQINGIDISKHGVEIASKRMKREGIQNLFLAVASSFELPFSDNCADIIISIFAPVCDREYARVLKKDGRLFIVAPDENHLFGLKKVLYEKPYKNKENDYKLTSFSLYGEHRIKFNITLKSREDIHSLFLMTPYYYKTSKDAQEKLVNYDRLETECEFIIYEYKKD